MSNEKFERPVELPGEGKNRFYDYKKSEDRIAGLEYAIRRTEERIKNDPSRPEGVFEEHLENLRKQLKEVKK